MGEIKRNRRFFVLLLGAMVLLAAGNLSFGQADSSPEQAKTRKLAGVLRLGGATMLKDNYGGAFSYGGGFLILFSDEIALELILDRYSIPVKEDLQGLGEGTLQTTPLLFSAQKRFPLGRFTPYASLGVGFYFFHYDRNKPMPHNGNGSETNIGSGDNLEDPLDAYDVADRFALHVGGGVDVRVVGNLDLSADLRYSLVKTWVQERGAVHVKPEEQEKFSLNALTLYVGFRYYF